MSKKKKELEHNEEVIKATLEKLIRHSKEGIAMIEAIEKCYGFMGQVSTDENLSEEFIKEIVIVCIEETRGACELLEYWKQI